MDPRPDATGAAAQRAPEPAAAVAEPAPSARPPASHAGGTSQRSGAAADATASAAATGSPDSLASRGGTAFDRAAAERILARAIALSDDVAGLDDSSAVSEAALLEAAEELGVDPSVLRRAATEERIGLLEGSEGWADRVVGPGVVMATRLLDEPAPAVMERVDTWLRRQGSVRRRRLSSDGLSADYVRRSDAAAGIQRSLRSLTGREDLGRVRRLRVLVHPVDEQRCILAFGADLQMERTAALAGGSTVAGVGSTVSVLEALGTSGWIWLGVPASAALGLGVMRIRAMTVSDVEVALSGVLDRVEAGEAPAGVIEDVRRRLLGGIVGTRRVR